MLRIRIAGLALFSLAFLTSPLLAGHRLITQGNGKLAIVDAEGKKIGRAHV